ncbi:MAG: hypothetical protein A2508_00945 [Candidatus Lambdaproteobacteria bacterium RIFOXYD12_FULL_49_8]|uniref:Uncharacterized protein n=1 Tax=Candidatus Lambdaproteobacteria bacterium RIFOXYD2_FULL_50_16 TaxID=1817772 RepID=A0A1F6GBD4_9PROT|nr:MAG: hypothetical protein A2527_04810 [Candidatus Lambdaproteobacteria bacterium RIFOXYD2_FULL_50_16]OGG97512.1 MAG: hypothetical protein A2508_00945 [Candidatus Lambdaproteobacteria bacterium RIFOXYD12_FULL_49_8]
MRPYKLFILLPFCLAFLPCNGFSYDFGNLRQDLKADLGHQSSRKPKMAIVYRTLSREDLKKSFNLIELKRDLAHEMVRSFRVPDPVVVGEMMKQEDQTYDKLLSNPGALAEFAQKTETELVLLVNLEPKGKHLAMDFKLLTAQNQPLSNHHLELSPEKLDKNPRLTEANPQVAPKTHRASIKEPKETLAQGGIEFVPREFMEDHNDSWIEINQTAFLNPNRNYLEIGTWPKSLPDTDIRPVRLRYEFTWPDLMQFGFQSNANAAGGHHSTYAHLKVQVVHLEEFSAAVGYRRRLAWDSANPEFNQGWSIDSFNDQRNKSTLYIAVSRKEQSLGLLGNFYLDNQQAGVGAKFLITEDIMAVFDGFTNYYDNPLVRNDAAAGIQFHSPTGTLASLVYRMDSTEVHFSLGVNW